MKNYVIANDLGTSGNKATLFNFDGEMIKSAVASYKTQYLGGNRVEQNPEDWWRAVCGSSAELLRGMDANDVAAISFSGQMMGCLCVDKKGAPLRPHIIWADMRAQCEQEYIAKRVDAYEFYRMTGHRISASYSLAKLIWVRNNEPEIYKNTYKVLNAKDYIVHRMTGEFCTDYSDASGTNAFDINDFEWSEKILDAAEVDAGLFPQAVESTHVVGELCAAAAAECGLAAGTPVIIGAGDGIAAATGALAVREGVTYNCLGSSSWIASAAGAPVFDDEMRTFNWAHMKKGLYSPCGTMQAAGASYAWIERELCAYERDAAGQKGVSIYKVMEDEILSSPVGANGLLFLPYLMGERSPRWNADATGTFVGLKMESTRADMLRSVLEGVATNLALILGILRTKIDVKEVLAIGGLAQSGVFLQMLADVFGVDTVPLNHTEEASSIGAAVAGGVGVGALPSIAEASRFVRPAGRYSPDKKKHARYEELMDIFNETYAALLDVYARLAHFTAY